MTKFKMIKISEKAHKELQRLSDKRKAEGSTIRLQFDVASELIVKAAKKECK